MRAIGSEVWLNWDDGPPDDQGTIDFTLQVVALDEAGNESDPQMVRIRDEVGGCRVVGGGSRGRSILVLGVLVLIADLRRRRRRAAPAVLSRRLRP
jgi:hypothetical protein